MIHYENHNDILMYSNSSIGRLRCRGMLRIHTHGTSSGAGIIKVQTMPTKNFSQSGFSSVAWSTDYGNTAEETLVPLLQNENDKQGTSRFRLFSMGKKIEKAILRKPIHSDAKSVTNEFGLDPVNVFNTKNIFKLRYVAAPIPYGKSISRASCLYFIIA